LFPVQSFENSLYHVRVDGPDGFFREYKDNTDQPGIEIDCEYERSKRSVKQSTRNPALKINNSDPAQDSNIEIKDNAYNNKTIQKALSASTIILNLEKSFGWYDFTISLSSSVNFERRYAGRVETRKPGHTDPLMGNSLV
jgi:phospholipase C